MSYFHYGLGFIVLILVIAAIKADYQVRIFAVLALVAAMAYLATRKKR